MGFQCRGQKINRAPYLGPPPPSPPQMGAVSGVSEIRLGPTLRALEVIWTPNWVKLKMAFLE